MEQPLAGARWVKVAPHIIDTVLLACGITMAIQLSLSPFVHDWLLAKIVGLVSYVGFGVLAMRAASNGLRWLGFTGAILSAGYIFTAAFTRQSWPA